MKKMKIRVIPSIVLVVSLCLSCFAVYQIEEEKLDSKRERTRYVTNSQVSKLQYSMDSLLLKTQTLEMLVIEGNGEVKNFDTICEKLLDSTAIRSLQLAPDGVVTFVYPLKGNEQAFGDLFTDPDRKIEAEYARDSGNMTLAGPYELEQGGLGAVARRPIYLKDAEGNSTFWGFSIIILNIPEAFYPAELDQFEKEGFSYKLQRINPNTKDIQVIDESSSEKLLNPINISFDVPNGIWTFCVMPKEGWIVNTEVFAELTVALLVAVLLFVLAMAAVRLVEQRKKMSELSMKDALTGLQNQRMLLQTLSDQMEKRIPFTLFYLDFDGFKSINDTYGHAFGDLFLIASAQRLMTTFEMETSIFRIGGDEFAIIFEQVRSDTWRRQEEEKILDAFSEPFVLEGHTLIAKVSVGAAQYPLDAQEIDPLIRIADQSMYQMKSRHKAMA